MIDGQDLAAMVGSRMACSKITSLETSIPVRADEAVITWLKENVEDLRLDKWV